jgi:hypothetical protein
MRSKSDAYSVTPELIDRSRDVPPRGEALRDTMLALFDLLDPLKDEKTVV